MNVAMPVVFLSLALTLAACDTAKRDAPMAPSTPIAVPPAEVSPEIAGFSGIWSGRWDGMLDGKLAVQSVRSDGGASGIYAWGDHPRGRFQAGSSNFEGRIVDGILTLDTFGNGAKVTYTMQSDGTLAGAYDIGGSVSRGIFIKAP